MATDFNMLIDSISQSDWNRLFDLIPEIEKGDKFGNMAGGQEIEPGLVQIPFWDWTEITTRTVKVIYDLKLVLNFDWSKWEEGKTILQNKQPDFNKLDSVTLCKLLTTIIRADRFNDGILVSNFEDGNILKIIKALKNNQSDKPSEGNTDIRAELLQQQEQFIWLAHAEGKSFSEIEKILNLPRKTISLWEVELKPLWQEVAAIKKLYVSKGIKLDFKVFHDWIKAIEHDKKCAYCGITENEIKELFAKSKTINEELTKRNRGPKLELDRKKPNSEYDDLDNIVYACYWCNNAKTDTFTHEEFMEVGKVFSNIWKKRLGK